MIAKQAAAGSTTLLGVQIFNAASHLLIISDKPLAANATLEIRAVDTNSGKETKIFPKAKLNILPEINAQRAGYFTDKAFLIEICEGANLNMAGRFLIVDLEGLDNTATHQINTVEEITGAVKNEPIIYDRLTIPTGIKRQTFGVQEAQILALPNTTAIIELSLYTKAGKVVRIRFEELLAMQRRENDIIYNDTTAAFGVGSIVLGYRNWLTQYVDHCDRVEIETDGTTMEVYVLKNTK